MAVSLTMPTGQIVENPTLADLTQALDQLLASDDPEADLWLEHDEGWLLSVVTTGDLFLENPDEEAERYWTLGPLERPAILLLLQMLATGNIAELRAQPWEEGE